MRALWDLVACLASFTVAVLLAGFHSPAYLWPAASAAIAFWWGLQWGTPAALPSVLQPLAVAAGLALLAEALAIYANLGAALPMGSFAAGCAAASLMAVWMRARERATRPQPHVVETASQLASLLAREKPRRLVIANPDGEHMAPPRLLLDCKLAGIELATAAMVWEQSHQRVPIEKLRPVDLLWPDASRANRPVMALQAIYSNLIGLALLAALSPILILAAVASRLAAGPGALFERVECAGFQGVPFYRRRFRVTHATTGRPTRIGEILTRWRLAGLPQLINLVRGEMALFGPQPVRLEFSEYLDRLCPLFSRRLSVKPGIFGWAQANSRSDPPGGSPGLSLQEEHRRLSYDLYYLYLGSPLMDLEILLRTALGARRFAPLASAKAPSWPR
ncbi:MAG TPA: sugar transferase [Bryobacteraceae bacterium]|nr:sugar transferase [Bryobacteraceae bacterium]